MQEIQLKKQKAREQKSVELPMVKLQKRTIPALNQEMDTSRADSKKGYFFSNQPGLNRTDDNRQGNSRLKIQLITPKSMRNNSAQLKESKLNSYNSPNTSSTAANSQKNAYPLQSHMIVLQKNRLPEPPTNFKVNDESDFEVENTQVNELRKQLSDFFQDQNPQAFQEKNERLNKENECDLYNKLADKSTGLDFKL